MKEELLHFIWSKKVMAKNNLFTTEGEQVIILDPGKLNPNAGPDFLNAKIMIGKKLWVGHVEVHIRSNDWFLHKHQHDPAYNNVILHVVYEDNLHATGWIPTLELNPLLPDSLLKNYNKLQEDKNWIPCSPILPLLPEKLKAGRKKALIIERLSLKAEKVKKLLKETGNNWDETAYRMLAGNFGFNVNTAPFGELAARIPFNILYRHRRNLFQMESLLFGTAGFLNGIFADEYPKNLRKEYFHLSRKFRIIPLEPHRWKFLKMRPANFPTLRIAQFASFIHRTGFRFEEILKREKPRDFYRFFSSEPSEYWVNHYQLDKKTTMRNRSRLGKFSIQNILINTVVPLLFTYGKGIQDPEIIDRALNLLRKCPPEKNHILRTWEDLGMENNNALSSQALIHLKKNWCDEKKCLGCEIGQYLLHGKK